ncbi:hypothetical protein E2562_014432 [Oryza meyeriana var. granulata]|uniref:Uncharacterized protein n=1 Tax=Oryza meyeriana var. granulata TaxID=110450 RepID=A0A6G1CQS7_9ORYZ|nr:hypothetical protein E2562_014432 [Oryza meyeriana var. granulata]
MEPSDLNTHLPPRKRLLAGLRMAATPCGDAEPAPSALLTGDLAARLRQMMGSANASSSSPEEIVEAARSAASAAAEAAAAARATAAEKAAVAAKARAAARAAMEFLDSISRPGSSRNGLQLKVKSRKKHVQVKLLYKPNGRLEGRGGSFTGDASSKPRRRRESDEEIARKLHRAMNSSPRISFTGPKRPRTIGGENGGVVDASNGSSAHPPTVEVSGITNGCSLGQSSDIPASFFKHEGLDDDKNSSGHAAKSRVIAGNGVGAGNLSAGRKVKIKRKELLLNKHNSKDTKEAKEIEPSVDSIRYDESKSNGAEKRLNLVDAKDPPCDGLAPMKISSVWKFKKFKTSHCSSDSKVLHNVCPSTSAAETSASVKAD